MRPNIAEKIGKWIEADELPQTGKTRRFEIRNSDNELVIGDIRWFGRWRKYAFFPCEDCAFEQTCLRDIATFIDLLMSDRKAPAVPMGPLDGLLDAIKGNGVIEGEIVESTIALNVGKKLHD